MSGIVGIVNLDGAPVERGLLERLTGYLAFRGPDRQEVWQEGSVGFGHTLLRTTPEGWFEQQPFSLDGESWITADARVDGRTELIERLGLEEGLKLKEINDAELILRAYLKWGEECVEYLIGDFAFAIWDGRRQKLFCARDQFGVKLFYYARVGNCLIFSNTLNCIRQHPLVSDRLNEQAIGDFLLFDMNYNLETTFFSDIQRLPGGHVLSLTRDGTFSTRRYWTLPVPELIRYKRDSEYIEHFKEVMGQAVGDRLRNETEKVGIFFSGGMDSTTIAATALEVARKKGQPLDLQGFTRIYNWLIPDEEFTYSSLAASALGITTHYMPCDNFELYEGWKNSSLQMTPEPYHHPLYKMMVKHLHEAHSHSRVVLYGEGGDEALMVPTTPEVLRTVPLRYLVFDFIKSISSPSLFSPMITGFYMRLYQIFYSRLGIFNQIERWEYPGWIQTDFAQDYNLATRWDEIRQGEKIFKEPELPVKLKHILSPIWNITFEGYDAGTTYIPVEVRLPFLDIRLLRFLLALAPLPWFVNKYLARASMTGTLPRKILKRPKTTILGDPFQKRLSTTIKTVCDEIEYLPELDRFVNRKALITELTTTHLTSGKSWEILRGISLGYWLNTYAKINMVLS